MTRLEADRKVLESLISQTQLIRQRADLVLAEAAMRRERVFATELLKLDEKLAAEAGLNGADAELATTSPSA